MTAKPSGGELAAPLLQMISITKDFGLLRANDHIDLDVRQGEVHALLGENGAGKSTLMNILYGLVRPTAGEIRLRGHPVRISSPRAAIQHRIGMVHQHFMLIPTLSVAENVVLGLPVEHAPLLDLAGATARLAALGKKYGLEVDPHATVGDLPVGVQQRVEILKALYREAELLILDEPTAVLSPGEVQDFFRVLRGLAETGLSAIFIAHKLEEVLAVSQRITVLRRGQKVDTIPTAEASRERLAEMMVGRQVATELRPQPHAFGRPVLEVSDVSAEDETGRPALRDIDLQVCAGEIVAIAGVDGNGQQQLAEALAGLRKVQAGRIKVNGADLTGQAPDRFIEHGVAYIPADRQQTGLILDFSVADNLVLKSSDRPPFARHGVLDPAAARLHCREIVAAFGIQNAQPGSPARRLSGGNQQKVVLARELDGRPVLLIATHPTRGLDIGATEYIHQRFLEQRERGLAIVLISTELDEVLALADRIVVMFRGEMMGELAGEGAQVETIGRMMLGERLTGSGPRATGTPGAGQARGR